MTIRAKMRAIRKNVFASSKQSNLDYAERMIDSIARMIINDVVSEGMTFKTAYNNIVNRFALKDHDLFALAQSLKHHGWSSNYSSIGSNGNGPRGYFEEIREYYLAPLDQYNYRKGV